MHQRAPVPQFTAHYQECLTYKECDSLSDFVTDSKAILGVTYEWPKSPTATCAAFAAAGVSGKYCNGSKSEGLCKKASAWVNCF